MKFVLTNAHYMGLAKYIFWKTLKPSWTNIYLTKKVLPIWKTSAHLPEPFLPPGSVNTILQRHIGTLSNSELLLWSLNIEWNVKETIITSEYFIDLFEKLINIYFYYLVFLNIFIPPYKCITNKTEQYQKRIYYSLNGEEWIEF